METFCSKFNFEIKLLYSGVQTTKPFEVLVRLLTSKKRCFYFFILCFLGYRLLIWIRFVAVGFRISEIRYFSYLLYKTTMREPWVIGGGGVLSFEE